MKQLPKALLDWYGRTARKLPWRATRDPYRIWVSEIMLQQTRVAAATPYFERFIARFPDAAALAAAPLDDLLTLWSGLGYYSRARNMHNAAREIVRAGGFPRDYDSIRRLPGIGDYTAAAIASIAFGLPYAVLDGNVLRVLARLTNDSGNISTAPVRKRLHETAQRLLDPSHPGDFNQALMELGATVCLPKEPRCTDCPISADCEARRLGRQNDLPVRTRPVPPIAIEKTLLVIERDGAVLLWRRTGRGRMHGFWELPDASQLPRATMDRERGAFRHTITNHHYAFTVVSARMRGNPRGFSWIERVHLARLPLSTTAKKALALAGM